MTAAALDRSSHQVAPHRADASWLDVRRVVFTDLLKRGGAFRRIVVVGASGSMTGAIRDAGIAEDVDNRFGQPGTADLVAVLAGGSRPSIADVARELAPDGIVWWESDRRRRCDRWRTPRGMARRLHRHGLVATDAYVIRPEPARAEWYVPIGHKHALRWFLDCLHTPTGLRQIVGQTMLRSVAAAGPRAVSVLTPFHAVVAVHEGADPSIVEAGTALLNHGGNRGLVVAFGPDDRAPQVIMKIARGGDGVQSLAAEHSHVSAVRELVGEPLSSSMPRSLANPSPTQLVQQVLPGRPFAGTLGRPWRALTSKEDDLHAVVRWIGDLHSHPVDPEHPWGCDLVEEIAAQLDGYRDVFAPQGLESDLLDDALCAAVELIGAGVPRVWEHGDLTLWNVLIDGHDVNVVDWECAHVGLPLVDALRIAEQWHAEVLGLRGVSERAVARGWLARPPRDARRATRVARAAIDGYIGRLDLPPRLEDVAHVVGLATAAVRRDQHFARVGAAIGDRRFNAPVAQLAHLATEHHRTRQAIRRGDDR